jgi:hypothetical protein
MNHPRENPRAQRKSRWRKLLVPVVAAALWFVGCQGWPDWDQTFQKRFYGWVGGDSDCSIALPGNRILWTFGDSFIMPDDTATDPKAQSLFGNTVAVGQLQAITSTPPHTPDADTTDPSSGLFDAATDMHFFSRANVDMTLAADNLDAPAGKVVDITYRGGNVNLGQFFNKDCVGGGTNRGVLWPVDGIVRGDLLAVFTWDVNPDKLQLTDIYLQKYSNIGGDPKDWHCEAPAPIKLPSQYLPLPEYTAPSTGDAMNDTMAAIRNQDVYIRDVDPPLLLGAAVVHSGGYTYIFGSRPHKGYTNIPGDVKLARVADGADLFSPLTAWEFLYETGYYCPGSVPCWVPHYPVSPTDRDALRTVAPNVPSEFSVDELANPEPGPDKPPVFIMVHGYQVPLLGRAGEEFSPPADSWTQVPAAINFRGIRMRSTTDIEHFPDATSGVQAAFNGNDMIGSSASGDPIGRGYSDQHNDELLGSVGGTIDPVDKEVISGQNNAFRGVHAVKGHGAISDATTSGVIYASYYVHGQNRLPSAFGSLIAEFGAICPTSWSKDEAGLLCEPEGTLAYGGSNSAFASDDLANRVSLVRFIKLNLNRVYPWCKAAGLCCVYGEQYCQPS